MGPLPLNAIVLVSFFLVEIISLCVDVIFYNLFTDLCNKELYSTIIT